MSYVNMSYSLIFFLLLKFISQKNVDEDEVYNNPNLHSEDQDELEIPENNF